MTRRLALLVAAIAIYDVVAFRTRKVPTITHIVHETRRHFRPVCPACGVAVLVPRRPSDYRGFLPLRHR